MASSKNWLFVFVLVSFLFQSVTCKKPLLKDLHEYTFEQYVEHYNKHYASDAERAKREQIFYANIERIVRHNSDPKKTWTENVNHLTDLTEDEYNTLLGIHRPTLNTEKRSQFTLKSVSANTQFLKSVNTNAPLKTHVDWRDAGIMSPVKDQGHCGSCWTFASAALVESYWALSTGELHVLSEQQILDCAVNSAHCGGTGGGCEGGTAALAFASIIDQGGLASEWTYPYDSYRGKDTPQCRFNYTVTKPVAKIRGMVFLPENSQEEILRHLSDVGPLVTSVDASSWRHYEGGVFDGCNKTEISVDHLVVLVGYGTDEKLGDYWLVRNSWSPHWGEKGYIRIRRTSTAECGWDNDPLDGNGCPGGPPRVRVCGTCGIAGNTGYVIPDLPDTEPATFDVPPTKAPQHQVSEITE